MFESFFPLAMGWTMEKFLKKKLVSQPLLYAHELPSASFSESILADPTWREIDDSIPRVNATSISGLLSHFSPLAWDEW